MDVIGKVEASTNSRFPSALCCFPAGSMTQAACEPVEPEREGKGRAVWRIPGTGSLVGCRPWGRAESDTTEAI